MRLDQTARSVFLSWSDLPAAILWYGAETRPVAPDRSNMVTTHNLDRLFGGVVLVSNAMFAQVNGYANSYWGWGPEDIDLTNRFKKRPASPSAAEGEHFNLLPSRNTSPTGLGL